MMRERIMAIRARLQDHDAWVEETYARPPYHAPNDEHHAAREKAWEAYAAFHDHAADDLEYLLEVIADMRRRGNAYEDGGA
jgi:hypothetical protein